ncbi:MAG: hypothetical protein JSU05_11710 [Bacteroidetes bacterium]|nr:hypothetical protein [Bacteroidota bacterium]
MYSGLLHLHSGFRWIILLLLVLVVIRNFGSGKPFTAADKKLGLFTMIFADIQLLVGLYQWFAGPWGLKNIQSMGMKDVMTDPYSRFFAVEHFIGMLIAIVLIHVGYNYMKKPIADKIKRKRSLVFFGLSLLIILISIPWPFRTIFSARGWF